MSSIYNYALKGHFEELRRQLNGERAIPSNIDKCIQLVEEVLPQTNGDVREKLETLRVELMSLSTTSESTATEPLKPMRKVGIKTADKKRASK